ncbi:MAG: type IV pilus assembly protein PilM [Proteobacteria bacterium]|nr:type IV pilus assembly protein PilM [Pseudomonadota bacterium]
MLFNKPLLSIDIGSSSIKAIEISGGEHKKLHSLGIELLPRGAIEAGIIRDAEVVKSALKKLIDRLKLLRKNRRVAISVSGVSTLIKRVSVALSEDMETDDALYEEAKQHFHSSLDEMYFRHQEIESAFVEPGHRSFILVAAKIETIEQYVDLTRRSGLRVGITDCDVFCLSNMFDYNYPVADALSMAVNIGASATQVIFLYNGEFLYSREFFVGGNDISERIAERLQVDFDNAESLKISASMGDQTIADRVRSSVQELNEQIAAEINTTLSYFQSEEMSGRFEKVDHIFLVGGAASTLDLGSTISAILKAPVQIINPFQRVDIKPSGIEMDYIMTQGALFGVSVGLGLRDLKEIV